VIYSASRRTDMPAFHPEALALRLRRARRLEAVVYWTKDPRPLVRHPALSAWALRWPAVIQFTVTGLADTAWEPAAPRPEDFADALAELARRLPAGAIRWRFDPVIVLEDGRRGEDGTVDRFRRTLDFFERHVGPPGEATLSFPAPYGKALRRVRAAGLDWPALSPERQRDLVRRLAACWDGRLRACCQPALEGMAEIAPARCVDAELFDRLYGAALGATPPDGGQRPGCGCARSTDIGAYTMVCGHGCRYCYASPDTRQGNPPARTDGGLGAGEVPPRRPNFPARGEPSRRESSFRGRMDERG
jgi:hypothetical protein